MKKVTEDITVLTVAFLFWLGELPVMLDWAC